MWTAGCLVSSTSEATLPRSFRQRVFAFGGTAMDFTKVPGAVGQSGLAMNALHWTDGPAFAVRDWVMTVGQGIQHVGTMLILVRYSMS
jgi:hypothetical protein